MKKFLALALAVVSFSACRNDQTSPQLNEDVSKEASASKQDPEKYALHCRIWDRATGGEKLFDTTINLKQQSRQSGGDVLKTQDGGSIEGGIDYVSGSLSLTVEHTSADDVSSGEAHSILRDFNKHPLQSYISTVLVTDVGDVSAHLICGPKK